MEVSQRNKSLKTQTSDQNLTEDELLSLIQDEEVKNDKPVENKFKKYKQDLEDNNARISNNSGSSLNLKEEKMNNYNKKCQSVYHLNENVLLRNGSRNGISPELQINTPSLEISEQDDENEKGRRLLIDETQDDVLDEDNTESNVIALNVNDEIENQSQLTDFEVENSEDNRNYEKLVNGQVDDLNFTSIYLDENSVDNESNREDNTYCITHISEDMNNIAEENISSDSTKLEEQKESIRKLSTKKENHGSRFYCRKCNRDFSTKTNLNRHMHSHDGNRPFSCAECSKSFTQKSTLKQHMYTHTGERPYVCEVCNRGFTQCKSLIFHMRRHTGEKPFHCEYCLITFRQKDALRVCM